MIWFFYGDNNMEISREIWKIREDFARENVRIFDLSTVDLAQISAEVFGRDLFGSRKLFVLTNVFSSALSRDFLENLVKNINQLPDENSLVFTDEKPDKRTKIFKDFTKIADAREFSKLKDWQLSGWLSAELNSRKITMNADAQNEFLRRKNGADDTQSALAIELDKLEILAKNVLSKDEKTDYAEGEISREMIEKYVDEEPDGNAFEILNLAIKAALTEGKSAGKIRKNLQNELENLRKCGEDPNRFLGLLTSQIFALSAVIFSVPDASKSLKINPFQLTKARETAAKIQPNARVEFAKNLAKNLAKTDAKMKLSTAENSWVLLENFLMNL